MKTLNTIQTLSKIGRVLSTIVMVFCIVGGCLCLAAIACLASGIQDIQIGDVTLKSLIEAESELTLGQMYAAMGLGALICAAEAVIAGFAARYFKRELNDGTPFTMDGAKTLKNTGIITICVSLGVSIIAAIVLAIFKHNEMASTDKLEISAGGNVTSGIMMIVTSLIMKHGTERIEGRE